ncbi:MAG: class I SAM-dependent methyltransferase [Clostridia bacterium]|nr:class I SAM-dependent methyltransferase [Clostridia bacterium]
MIEKLREKRERARERGEPVLRDESFDLLLKTVEKYKPKKILEIGTNEGLSGIAMLLTSKDAALTGIEIDEEKIRIAKENYKEFGLEDRAKIFSGDASEILPVITGEYDFIFLDGPKGHYFEYSSFLLPILKVGGVIFADNVLYRGMVEGKAPHKHATIKNSMQNYLKAVTENQNLSTTLYRIDDGVAITEKLK